MDGLVGWFELIGTKVDLARKQLGGLSQVDFGWEAVGWFVSSELLAGKQLGCLTQVSFGWEEIG